ncbi:MAG TPA: T9SS type A sorting domain-containing protein, partial [Crocinitomicaceae bacterium]|nr:T9SS type A sorting domain-containing protein [Crocinitomicaceae bacterium]
KAVHNTANAGTDIVDLSIDDDDYIYTLSAYWGTVVNELGDTLLPNSTSSSDMILERYSADGNLRSYSKIACKHDDIAYDIATYGNSVYTFSSSSFPFYIGADIDTIPYDSLSGMRAVILRLTENPTVATNEQAQASEIAVFPNPNNGIFTVQTPVKNSKITVHTLSGKLLYETKQVNEQTTIDLSHFPSGMYLLNVRSDKFSVTKKIVKE